MDPNPHFAQAKSLPIYRKGIEISLLLYAVSLSLSMSGTNIALGLTVFFSLWMACSEKIKMDLPKSFYAILVFFLWAAATDWIAEGRFDVLSLSSFSKTWNLAGMIFIPAGIARTSRDIKMIVKCLLLPGCAVVIFGFLEYAFSLRLPGLSLIGENRFYGFQSHPLHGGGLYCLLALTALSFFIFDRAEKPGKFFWGGCGVILILGVILTRSRSYYLALAAGSIVLLSFKGIRSVAAGILIGGALVLAVASVDRNFRGRLMTLSASRMDDSAKIRISLWKAARLMIQDHPLAGVGYRKWKENILVYSRRIPGWSLDQAAHAHAHNSYLTFAAETGVPGLMIFLTFWIFLIQEQFRRLRSCLRNHAVYPLLPASIAALLALLVAACFEHNLLTAAISLSLFFLIGLSRSPQES